jgi:hypothetical protein
MFPGTSRVNGVIAKEHSVKEWLLTFEALP